jgi:hypothetical protein
MMNNSGHYRPFPQIKRDCKTCKKYIEKVENRNGAEYMRCELSPRITIPYMVDGIKCEKYCAAYEAKDNE